MRQLGRQGFTYVELLMVFIIMGLMLTIAVPQFRRFRDRAVMASMKQDLRSFAMHEESYYYDRAVYSGDVGLIQAQGFQPTEGVVVVVNEATILGWSATISHGLVPVECYVFVGNAAPVGTAAAEGSVSCS